jgi:hypothetical protein
MFWEYVKKVVGNAISGAISWQGTIELLIAILLFFSPLLAKGSPQNTGLKKFFSDERLRLVLVLGLLIVFHLLIISPYQAYVTTKMELDDSNKKLADKAPQLDGFVNRFLVADEGGTGSIIFLELTVDNYGETPSHAVQYELAVKLEDKSLTNAEEINFSDEFKLNVDYKGKPWLLDLKRPQLISEKTVKPVSRGNSPRGWVAYRLPGIKRSQFQETNVVLSFVDFYGKKSFVTNLFWKGKLAEAQRGYDLTTVIPGAENIFFPIEPPVRTDWTPPELSAEQTNVVLFFGTNGMVISRTFAEAFGGGKRFSVSELPDYLLKDLDKAPFYSPRMRYVWVRFASDQITIDGKTVEYPIAPVVVSNRLYVEVTIPFSNERRKLVMSDAFSTALPIPANWDVNFSTNYDGYGNGIYAYEVVNELTNPVLQVTYFGANEVHVNGIFQVDSNSILASFDDQLHLGTITLSVADTNQGLMTASLQMENFHETLPIGTNESIASFGRRFTNEFFRPIFRNQKPIFKYPSNRNLGAFSGNFGP